MRVLRSQSSLLAIAFLLAVGSGCSREGSSSSEEPSIETASGVKLAKDGPTKSEIAGALQSELLERAPGVAVTTFAIEGQESLGNQVDPIFGQRFHAAAVLSEDLFAKDFVLDDKLFATVATEEGISLDIYGKIISRRYQDSWNHKVSLEGDPFVALQGQTRQKLETANKATVIQIGSDEEARQLDQWRSEGRLTSNPDIESIIIGTWDGECTNEGSQKPDWIVFTSFEPGGVYREGFARTKGWGAQYETEFARQRKNIGTWSVFGGGILDRRSNYNGGNRNVERIVSIEQDSYVSESGGRRCTWKRVDLVQQAQEAQEERERLARERAEEQQEKVAQYRRNEELFKVARKGDARRAQELVGEGVDLTKKDFDGLTALMRAAKYGHAEVVKVLLAAGADPSVKDRSGATALSLARRGKHADTERVLIDAGAKE